MKNNWSILLLLLLSFSYQIYSKKVIRKIDNYYLSDIRSEDLRLMSLYCKPHSTCIAILIDDNKNKFILKQKTRSALFSSVFEKLVTDIAYSVDIPTNLVKIIPCGTPFVGKKDKHMPATLHTFLPGVSVKYLPKHLREYAVSLRQVLKEGNVSHKVGGFTRVLVSRMSLHEDLPKIIALDTFVANHDRHRGNYFYDEETDRFFAIDFEVAFRKNLAEKVYQSFIEMIEDKNLIFSAEEIEGFVIYRDMLKRLIDKYNPKLLRFCINELIDNAGIDLTKPKDENKKAKYDKMMEANYNSCIKIVNILDVLIKKHH